MIRWIKPILKYNYTQTGTTVDEDTGEIIPQLEIADTYYELQEYHGENHVKEWYISKGYIECTFTEPLSSIKYDGTNLVLKTTEEIEAEEAEKEIKYYNAIYAANTDGALAIRVREYKNYCDMLGLQYSAGISDVLSAIMLIPDKTDAEKIIFGEQVRGTFDAIMLNLESIGITTARWIAWSQMPKLIQYLPDN